MVRTLFMTMPSMVGIVGRAPAVDEEVWCFFVFVTLWNYKVCDNGNAMKQYYYQNNYGVIARRKVCSCAPILNFFCGPPKFFNRGKFIPKIAIIRDFCGCRPTFFKVRTMKFGTTMRTWDSLHHAKFCKNRLRGYTPFGQMYTKKYSGEIWHEGAKQRLHPTS